MRGKSVGVEKNASWRRLGTAIAAAALLLWIAWPSDRGGAPPERTAEPKLAAASGEEPGLVTVEHATMGAPGRIPAEQQSVIEDPEVQLPGGPSYVFSEATAAQMRMVRWRGVLFGPGIPEGGSDSVPVQRGTVYTLTFPLPLVPEGTAGPWRMVVTSEFGLQVGTATVLQCDGPCAEPVELAFELRGGLYFAMATSAEPPIVDLTPYGPGEAQEVVLGASDGRWVRSIFELTPGLYSWQLRGGTEAQRGDVEVHGRDYRWVHIPAVGGGGEEPIIRVDARGAPDADLSLWEASVLPKEGGAALLGLHPVRAESFGPGQWAIRPGALDKGRWTLRIDALQGFRVEPVMAIFDVPGDAPVVTVTPIETTEAVFRMVDDESGDPVHLGTMLLMDGVAATVVRDDPVGRVILSSVPTDRETTLMVQATGYQLEAVAVPAASRHQEREIRLRRGWRGRVRTLDARGVAPVSGVSVHVDGVLAGTTDARGVLWLDEAPERSVEIAADNARLRVLHCLNGDGDGPPEDWIGGYVYMVEDVD